MQLTVVDGGSALAKARGVVSACSGVFMPGAHVVDVGCRTRELEVALEKHGVQYTGVDIDPGAQVVADLGEGLPFADGSADVVCALDVLEHLDDFHYGFAELCRVAAHHVVITLPNYYVIEVRLRLLAGRPVSGKYGLPVEPVRDRHRWVFSMNEARSFMAARAEAEGWRVEAESAIVGPRRARYGRLVGAWPNGLSSTYLVRLRPAD